MSPPLPSAHTVRPSLGPFALACLAGALVGHWLTGPVAGHEVPVLWLPIGFLTAALVMAPADWKTFPPVAVATTLLSGIAVHDQPWAAGLGQSVVYVSIAVAAAWLIRRRIEVPFTLARATHARVLIGVALGVPFAGGVVAAWLLDGGTGGSFWMVWAASWLANGLGLLLGVPLMLAWVTWSAQPSHPGWARGVVETGAVWVGTILITHAVFGEFFPNTFRAPAYVLPFLVWGAFRTGLGGSAGTILLVCLITLWHTTLGQGPFTVVNTDLPLSAWTLRVQGAGMAVVISVLLLATLVAERERVARERDLVLAQLRKAFAEIKNLRGMIPICAWRHKVRDDAGFWREIDSYLSTHTEATLSHSICPDCNVEMQAELPDGPATSGQLMED